EGAVAEGRVGIGSPSPLIAPIVLGHPAVIPAEVEPRKAEHVRAVIHDRYGPPEVLRVEEIGRPVPGEREVLVMVHAATVNRTDCHRRGADPWIWRLFAGLRRPRRRIPGSEFAGVVEAAGGAVTGFAVGDRVFGPNQWTLGAQAEFVCVRGDGLIAR